MKMLKTISSVLKPKKTSHKNNVTSIIIAENFPIKRQQQKNLEQVNELLDNKRELLSLKIDPKILNLGTSNLGSRKFKPKIF